MNIKIRPRTACIIGWSIAAVFILIAAALWTTGLKIIIGIAVFLAVCGVVFWIIYGRCPKCGTIARPKDDQCRKCGRWLDLLPDEEDE